MQKPTRIVAVALMGIGLGMGAGPVLAHNGGQMQQSQRRQMHQRKRRLKQKRQRRQMQKRQQSQNASSQSSHFSDKTIHEYAHAQGKLRQIAGKWRTKLQNAKNKKTKKQYRAQENQELTKVIKKNGLSVQQYNKLTKAMRHNHKLAKRIRNAQ